MKRIFRGFLYIRDLFKLKRIVKSEKSKTLLNSKDVVILNTARNSDNKGDYIIMDYSLQQLNDLGFNCDKQISTHEYIASEWDDIEDNDYRIKIICGTNLLYGSMNHERNWKYPSDLRKIQNCCLLGVGWGTYERKINYYTKVFYKYILSSQYTHSVRDMYTYDKLRKIGINNILYTGCVTMWKLTPEFCKTIRTKKSNVVVTTLTDYNKDVENDRFLIETLIESYEKVFFWVQGKNDLEYISKLVDVNNLSLVFSLEEYDSCLKQQEIDYIGTRLHAGIRALNNKCRSLIISIDNRAREISKETNLPIVERDNLKNELLRYIFNDWNTEIRIPQENIRKWKEQFSYEGNKM
ncbi:polysaccharide pyruvyl transferase family protein [Candidatus Galacturonibacter soehngenii]|uniref:Polysaccharide pyruvyl transferase family protein n=1 Tax=Candidatus Galacturonatibacter soehngenii TaxID=2307010 RepID=A0A7V7QKH2_9FIRM|nr:polysaccharide pyruvyl transferase family protein [Candidatus Galacturonibacter soehngenii]KAB1438242.1 polysaccharide pyruvyl transferase family protein [Candidatus Galacturonibacter soehngenii]